MKKSTLLLACLFVLSGCQLPQWWRSLTNPDPAKSPSNSPDGDSSVTSLSVSPLEVSLPAHTQEKLSAMADYASGVTKDVSKQASWSVQGNDGIVTISDTGMLSALTPGTTTVGVSFGGQSASLTVTVTDTQLTSIVIAPSNVNLSLGQSATLKATGVFSDGTAQDITSSVIWTAGPGLQLASAPSTFKATSLGTTMIKASVDGIKGAHGISSVVNVLIAEAVGTIGLLAGGPTNNPQAVIACQLTTPSLGCSNDIVVSGGELTLPVSSQPYEPLPMVLSKNGWYIVGAFSASSSNRAVLDVIIEGIMQTPLLFAKIPGSVTLTVNTTSGQATFTVNITDASLTGVTLGSINNSQPISVGSYVPLAVTGNYSDGSNVRLASASIVWSVSCANGSISNGALLAKSATGDDSACTVTASYDGYQATKPFSVSGQSGTSYTISTIAGNGNSGYSGDGGPAGNAELNYPQSLAADSVGNVYIADTSNHRVRKVDAAGIISTIAGNGSPGFSGDGLPATGARLNYPQGIALDLNGNIFLADSQNHRIRKVDIHGTINTVAGNGTYGFSGDGGPATNAELANPTALAIDSSGTIYILDVGDLLSSGKDRIRKVDTTGTISTIFEGNGGEAAIAFNSGGVYIADRANNYIRKIDTTGSPIATIAGNGTQGYSGDGGPANQAQLNFPRGISIDSSGSIYILDAGNDRVRKVNTSGMIETIAGNGTQGYSGDGGPAPSAQLADPTSIAIDSSGIVYFIDSSRIRKLASIGQPASGFSITQPTAQVTCGSSSYPIAWTALPNVDHYQIGVSSDAAGKVGYFVGLDHYKQTSYSAGYFPSGPYLWLYGLRADGTKVPAANNPWHVNYQTPCN